MKPASESLIPERFSLSRRDVLQLGALFGLTLSVPGFAAKSSAAPPLGADEMNVIGAVSEVIIPTTDTGGAIAAGVPAFVKTMVSGWFDDTEREHFLSGLREFSAGARKKYGKGFPELTAAQKDEYVGARLGAAEAAHGNAPHAPFVVLMKRLTIFGYYTSELGATIELHQRIATAQYEPAAEIKPGDRADSGILSANYPFNAS